jgi:hypothetical protein
VSGQKKIYQLLLTAESLILFILYRKYSHHDW